MRSKNLVPMMVFPIEVRLLPLLAIGVALLFVVSPFLGVMMVLTPLIHWLSAPLFSPSPNTPAEVRFWPSRP